MTVERLFKTNLKLAIANGKEHKFCQYLCGCTQRKIALTEAEAEAGKITWDMMMEQKLWNDPQWNSGWAFGSPNTMLNIGLVPSKLAKTRLGINRADWDSYIQVY